MMFALGSLTRVHTVFSRLLIVVATLVALIYVEAQVHATYAPEFILVRAPGDRETAQICMADIYSHEGIEYDKSLRALESLYEVLDPHVFFTNDDSGFHVLDTGFEKYSGEFEVEIRCREPDSDSFSYLVLTHETRECHFSGDGKFLLC